MPATAAGPQPLTDLARKVVMRILLPGLLAVACALQTAVAMSAPPANLKTNQDQASYIIGVG